MEIKKGKERGEDRGREKVCVKQCKGKNGEWWERETNACRISKKYCVDSFMCAYV